MQEIWARSLGWEDPLEKGTATHSSILSEILCGLSAFVIQGNTRLKYVILQFKVFD